MKPSRQKWNDATMWRPQKHNIKRTLAWIAKNKSLGQTKQGGKNFRFFFFLVFGWWPIKGLSGVRLDRWPVPKIPITCGLNQWRPSSPCAVSADTISILPPSFAPASLGGIVHRRFPNTNLCWANEYTEWDCNYVESWAKQTRTDCIGVCLFSYEATWR